MGWVLFQQPTNVAMKRLLAVPVLILALLGLVGCDNEPEGENRNQRIDRLYSECIEAGGSFEYNGSLPYWNCTINPE